MPNFIADSIKLPADPRRVRYQYFIYTSPGGTKHLYLSPGTTVEAATSLLPKDEERRLQHLGEFSVTVPVDVHNLDVSGVTYCRETYK